MTCPSPYLNLVGSIEYLIFGWAEDWQTNRIRYLELLVAAEVLARYREYLYSVAVFQKYLTRLRE